MDKILVVHHDHHTRGLFREMLESWNYSVIEAENGAEGVTRCREEKVDLVIVDMYRLRRDGLKIIFQFRQECPELKVIATTADSSTYDKNILEIAKELGVNELLSKPLDMEILRTNIRKVIEDK